MRLVVVQRVAHHPRELLQIVLRLVGRLPNERIERVERVEEHVRVELALQGLVLVDEIFGAQLFVLEQHALAASTLVVQITGARNDTGNEYVAQRMQVVMQHGRDGRDSEMFMGINKTFAQQITGYQRNDKGHRCQPTADLLI